MSSINGASSLLTAQRILNTNSRSIVQSLERLATGQRINRGADDPAGLIASENLRATLSVLEAEVRTLHRADHVANVADGALGSTSDLLIEANGLAVQAANSAGMSPQEQQAIQAQLDSILSTVDSIGGNTSFNGDPLLDGTATITAGNASVDLPNVTTGSLGETDIDGTTFRLSDLRSGGSLSLTGGNAAGAQQVLRNALTEVTTARGSVGSFQRNAVGARLASTQIGIENLAAANSLIRDTNYAEETASLNRSLVAHKASLKAIGIMLPARGGLLDLLG